ncbi:MAG: leucine-rich repeat domain-containing protein, partial [Clostridia bacterium]|nr:leucine-rich repeat domain-containing protein [Clostridia bacterium]
NSDYVCTICNNKHVHNLSYDEKTHWYDCNDICDKSADKVNHTFENGKCEFCGFMKGSEGLIYSLNSDGISYTIAGVESDIENMISKVVISEYYDGKPVTVIGEKAFYSKRALSQVYIPKTIKTIKESAFSGCTALVEVNIPSSVKSIEENVFENCYGITIYAQAKNKPSGWNTSDWRINQFCYYPIVWDSDNNNVAEDGYIYFVDNERGIVKYGIKGNQAIVANQPITNDNIELKAAVIYNEVTYSVTSIANYAFYMNDVITQIEIQRNTLTIGDYAFYGCSNLQELNWRENGKYEIDVDVEKIGNCAFAECNLLSEFVIPSTVTTIGAGMLQGCDKINKIIIPETVSKMGDYVFRG